jgi:putative Mg2+ transporter-C (MgtC) family protein
MLQLYFLGQVALGFLLGGILGWQREQSGRAAGPRTYALVTGGAVLFTLAAKQIFGLNGAPFIAQIITGIGFIGAGTIIHHDDRIEGITTAAGLWITTAIGIAIGLEAYILAIGTALLSLGILFINDKNKSTKIKSSKTPKKLL